MFGQQLLSRRQQSKQVATLTVINALLPRWKQSEQVATLTVIFHVVWQRTVAALTKFLAQHNDFK